MVTKNNNNNISMPSAQVKVDLKNGTKVPYINIKNYDNLYKVSVLVAKRAEQLAKSKVSRKDLRSRRRIINKLKKAIKGYKKYYEQGYKFFNKQVLRLTKTLGIGTKALSGSLKQYQKQDKKNLKNQLKPIMHKYCQNAIPPIPDQPIPDDCLKKSMSKIRRARIMKEAVQQGEKDTREFVYWKRLHVAKIRGNKVIDPRTHKPIGNTIVKSGYVLGKPEDIQKLLKVAEKLHVYLDWQ